MLRVLSGRLLVQQSTHVLVTRLLCVSSESVVGHPAGVFIFLPCLILLIPVRDIGLATGQIGERTCSRTYTRFVQAILYLAQDTGDPGLPTAGRHLFLCAVLGEAIERKLPTSMKACIFQLGHEQGLPGVC